MVGIVFFYPHGPRGQRLRKPVAGGRVLTHFYAGRAQLGNHGIKHLPPARGLPAGQLQARHASACRTLFLNIGGRVAYFSALKRASAHKLACLLRAQGFKVRVRRHVAGRTNISMYLRNM
jgi:hypothetical protein